MTPVAQTILHTDSGPAGNCVQAAVASILSLPLKEVPHFVEQAKHEWRWRLDDWARERGYEALWSIERKEINYGRALTRAARRYDGYYIAYGASPRGGMRHAVVYRGSDLAHDPHPEGGGLLHVDETLAFLPHDPGAWKRSP